MICVLVMISPKQRQKTLYERIYRAKETKSSGKRKALRNVKKDLKMLKKSGHMKSKRFLSVKLPIQNVSEN